MPKIAVVGMSCYFPKAESLPDLYRLLCQGETAITEPPKSRNLMTNLFNKYSVDKSQLLQGGYVDAFNYFDDQFFKIMPRESKLMDPQQRLLLQATWHGLEDALINPCRIEDSNTGVFVGVMGNEWAAIHFNTLNSIDRYTGTGNGYCMLANRVSYQFKFHGPSMAIDTACSSSLMAIRQAEASLRSGDCDLAIAAGVNYLLTPGMNLYYQKMGLLSKKGQCHSFSAKADGITRGEGVGVVILQRLNDAIAQNKRIYAVIENTTTNHNGQSNGIMAPSSEAQIRLLKTGYQKANIPLNDISFIEAHGTGTLIGDPIETKALSHVLGHNRSPKNPLPIGSIKSNIGHLEGAAGVAGFIKTCLGLHHKKIFPSLHANTINPYIKIKDLNLKVQTSLEDIKPEHDIFYAGVSSFGLGGTNVHIILSHHKTENRSSFSGTNLPPQKIKHYPIELFPFEKKLYETESYINSSLFQYT